MVYKGRRIQAGDKLWTMAGAAFIIADWSEGTGDIYGHSELGVYINIKRMPELSWNFPFISRRT